MLTNERSSAAFLEEGAVVKRQWAEHKREFKVFYLVRS
jgi:hypothetical protein